MQCEQKILIKYLIILYLIDKIFGNLCKVIFLSHSHVRRVFVLEKSEAWHFTHSSDKENTRVRDRESGLWFKRLSPPPNPE